MEMETGSAFAAATARRGDGCPTVLLMRYFLAMRYAAAHRAAVRGRGWIRVFVMLAAVLWGFSGRAEGTNPPSAAKFKISGYGIFGDLRLKRIIKLLEVPKTKPEFFDANFME